MTSLVVRILQEMINEVQSREAGAPVEDVDAVLSELNEDMDPRNTREILLSLEADVAYLTGRIEYVMTMVQAIGGNVEQIKGLTEFTVAQPKPAPVMNVSVNDNTKTKDISDTINSYFEEKAKRSEPKDKLSKRRPIEGL